MKGDRHIGFQVGIALIVYALLDVALGVIDSVIAIVRKETLPYDFLYMITLMLALGAFGVLLVWKYRPTGFTWRNFFRFKL